MGRNKTDFVAGLYHGSTYPFNSGDIISAEFSNSENPEGHKRASATDNATEASRYSGSSGKVYRVEPVNASDLEIIDHGESTGKHYESASGFRVVEPLWN